MRDERRIASLLGGTTVMIVIRLDAKYYLTTEKALTQRRIMASSSKAKEGKWRLKT